MAEPVVDKTGRTLRLHCRKCGGMIELPVQEVMEAGGIGKVAHSPGLCIGDTPVVDHGYRVDVAITRDGEKLAGAGTGVRALTLDVALDALLPRLLENWERMAGLAGIAETEVIAEARTAVESEVMAELARQEGDT